MRFEGQTVFITGASRGIGAAVALAFHAEGARVIGTCTRGGAAHGGQCDEWIDADFAEAEGIAACVDRVRTSQPSVLVNNAGINRIAPFVDVPADDFMLIHRVNVLAPFLLCQAAIPAMKARGKGRIVNIASIFGCVSKAFRASYSSSKFALDGMTAALAAEHAVHGIMANCISPGFVDTELTRGVLGDQGMRDIAGTVPAGRLALPKEIAALVLFLASDDNTFVSGQNIPIDGGFTRV